MSRADSHRGITFLGVALGATMLVGAAFLGSAASEAADAYTADYCEPAAATKLLYSDRAYLVLQPEGDAPLRYRYRILTGDKTAERTGQLIFREQDESWQTASDADSIAALWPLRPDKSFSFERIEHNGERIAVNFKVLGLEPLAMPHGSVKSWKIRRLDRDAKGVRFIQFLWYAPEFCTLAAFTDSQQRYVTLLRVLKPGDADYDRPLARRRGRLVFSDTGDEVK